MPQQSGDRDNPIDISALSGDPAADSLQATVWQAKGLIGPYQLLQPIGSGGMGEVWLAEQTQPVRRRVALKLIKAGMDTGEVVARFQSERQALALMDHPSIAKVFDAGSTPQGRPYFVMEYITGIPITDYCDQHRMTLRERLELFVQVCEGVQHAHQKAIIHRDLKPSNILVSEVDGKPLPRIIDFGVAKAISHGLIGETPVHADGGDSGDAGLHESRAGRLVRERTWTRAPTCTRWGWCSMSCWWACGRSISTNWLSTRCCGGCGRRKRRVPAPSCALWATSPPSRLKSAAPILPPWRGNCAAIWTRSR